LLDVAATLVTRPLPLDRPLWAASFVTGLAGGRAALVVVVQHALTDGISGLAVLGALVDGAPPPEPAQGPAFPTPPPTAGVLAVDALRSRLRVIMSLPGRIRAAAGARSARPFGGSSLGQPEPRIGRATHAHCFDPLGRVDKSP
jgi:diacylglycerol O-acyltransferase